MEERPYKIQKFTTTPMKIPLFMLTRQKLKGNVGLRKYLRKKGKIYSRNCVPENDDGDNEQLTIRYLRHISGRHKTSLPVKPKSCPKRPLNVKTVNDLKDTGKIPPNMYDITKVPYASRQTYMKWQKTTAEHENTKEKKDVYMKKELDEDAPKAKIKTKGLLNSNVRTLKHTSRFMLDMEKGAIGPPPTKYDFKFRKCIEYYNEDVTKYKYAKSHRFLPQTNVGETKTFISVLTRNASFRPGPGRYRAYYGCACKRILNKIYEPDLYSLVLKARSLRALRLPHKKVHPQDYYCPLFQTVKGHGHTWLFKNIPPLDDGKEEKGKAQKNQLEGPSPVYIKKITNPKREKISFFHRDESIEEEPRIVFNCIQKFRKRKTIHNPKKLAFMSSAPRFKEEGSRVKRADDRRITVKKVPNYPISNIPLDQIRGKLHDPPKDHVIVDAGYSDVKKLYHFKSLPEAKLMVCQEDYKPIILEPKGFFSKHFKHEDFFHGVQKSDFSAGIDPMSLVN